MVAVTWAHGSYVHGYQASAEAGFQATGVDAVAAHNLALQDPAVLLRLDKQVVCNVICYVACLSATPSKDQFSTKTAAVKPSMVLQGPLQGHH